MAKKLTIEDLITPHKETIKAAEAVVGMPLVEKVAQIAAKREHLVRMGLTSPFKMDKNLRWDRIC